MAPRWVIVAVAQLVLQALAPPTAQQSEGLALGAIRGGPLDTTTSRQGFGESSNRKGFGAGCSWPHLPVRRFNSLAQQPSFHTLGPSPGVLAGLYASNENTNKQRIHFSFVCNCKINFIKIAFFYHAIKPQFKSSKVAKVVISRITLSPWGDRPTCSFIGPGFTPATTARAEAGKVPRTTAAVDPPEAADSAAVAVDFDHGLPRLTKTPPEIGTGWARIQSSAI